MVSHQMHISTYDYKLTIGRFIIKSNMTSQVVASQTNDIVYTLSALRIDLEHELRQLLRSRHSARLL